MRVLVFLLLVALIVGAIGFYLGWFSFNTAREGDKINVNLTIDKNRIGEDAERARDAARDLGSRAKEGAERAADRIKDGSRDRP